MTFESIVCRSDDAENYGDGRRDVAREYQIDLARAILNEPPEEAHLSLRYDSRGAGQIVTSWIARGHGLIGEGDGHLFARVNGTGKDE